MKIRIELDETSTEEEIIIRCKEFSEEIQEIQKAIASCSQRTQKFSFYKGDTEYFISLEAILFFETDANGICAHTKDSVYSVKYKLYELEELLPGYFVRVSKSTILNSRQVYAIDRNLTASSLVSFSQTHKQVYISRNYYKLLKEKMNQRNVSKHV